MADLKMNERKASALSLIKAYEGLRLRPYMDPVGYWTVGYGHLMLDSANKPMRGEKHRALAMLKFKGRTDEESARIAEELLREDYDHYAAWVDLLIDAPLHETQFAALDDFCFNLGPRNLRLSTLRRLINEGADDEQISSNFKRWVFAGGRKLRGLVRRRQSESDLFFSED